MLTNNLIWGYFERWGNKLISLLVFIILARLLEPKDFGLVAFAKLFIDYLESFAGQGMGLSIIQKKEINNIHLNTAFWINLISGIFFAVLLFFLAPIIEELFNEKFISDILKILAVMIVINSLSRVQVAILIRELNFKGLALRGFLMSISGGAVGITLAIYGFGVWSLVAQHITTVLVGLIALWSAAKWRPQFTFSKSAAKEMYIFASRVLIDQQVIFLSKRFDELLVGAFLGATLLGYYSVAKRIFETLADILFSTMSKVILGNFSKLQANVPEIINKARKVATFMAAFTFPIFMAGAAVSQGIVVIVFGEKWIESSVPLAILMLSGPFLLTPNLLHPLFYSIGLPQIPLKLNSYRAVVTVVLFSIGSIFGLIGITIGAVVRDILGAIVDFFYLKREVAAPCEQLYRIQLIHLIYCLPMVFAIVLAGHMLVDNMQLSLLLTVSSLVAAVVYFFTLVIFKADILSDLKTFVDLIFKRINNR